jgi:hypothetical protein
LKMRSSPRTVQRLKPKQFSGSYGIAKAMP